MQRISRENTVHQQSPGFVRYLRWPGNIGISTPNVPWQFQRPEPERPPCVCTVENLPEMDNPRENWFGPVRDCLDIECFVHDAECPNRSIVECDSPLHTAVRDGNEGILENLLTNGTIVDSKSIYDLTPLHIAAYRGNLRIAEILVNHGASVSSRFTFNGQVCIPLDLAILGRRESVVKFLLSHPNNDNKSTRDWVQNRLRFLDRSFDTIKVYLLASHLDRLNENRKTSLLDRVDACIADYQEVFSHLLYIRSDLSVYPNLLRLMMFHALEHEFMKVVVDFLTWAPDDPAIDYAARSPPHDGSTLLHRAIRGSLNDVARLMIELGHLAVINEPVKAETQILCTLEGDRIAIVELLLVNGANNKCPALLPQVIDVSKFSKRVEIQLCKTSTPNPQLHLVVETKHWNAIESCSHQHVYGVYAPSIDRSAKGEIIVKDFTIDREVTIAYLFHKFGTVEPVSIDAADGNGDRAIIMAVENGHEKVFQLLLKHGADVNVRNDNDVTAVMKAAERGKIHIVKTLLKRNAITETEGRPLLPSALGIALRKNGEWATERMSARRRAKGNPYPAIVELLVYFGADINHASTPLFLHGPEIDALLAKQVIKLVVARMDISERAFRSVIENGRLKFFRCVCQEEFDKLRDAKIGNSGFSFYDVMTTKISEMGAICGNGEVAAAMKAEEYVTSFPIYWRLITNNYKKGLAPHLVTPALGRNAGNRPPVALGRRAIPLRPAEGDRARRPAEDDRARRRRQRRADAMRFIAKYEERQRRRRNN